MSGFYQCGGCAQESLDTRYDKAYCEIKTRPHGYDKIIAFSCDLSFDDILDTAESGEWATAITAKKVLLSPFFGKLTIGEGSTETFEDGCGRKIPDSTTLPWEFTTISATDDYTDEDWWYAFHKAFSKYTWGFFNCDGRLYIDDQTVKAVKTGLAADPIAAVPLDAIGFYWSLNTVPQFIELNGPGKAGQWKASGEFVANHVLRSIKIPGLSELLSADA